MNSVTDMLTQTSDHYNSKKKVSRNWVTLTCSKEANSFLDKITANYNLPKSKTLEIIIKNTYKEMIASPKKAMERGVKIEKSINDFISKE
jgi:hypothetical protein